MNTTLIQGWTSAIVKGINLARRIIVENVRIILPIFARSATLANFSLRVFAWNVNSLVQIATSPSIMFTWMKSTTIFKKFKWNINASMNDTYNDTDYHNDTHNDTENDTSGSRRLQEMLPDYNIYTIDADNVTEKDMEYLILHKFIFHLIEHETMMSFLNASKKAENITNNQRHVRDLPYHERI